MSDRVLIGTRKGFFTIVRNASGWSIDKSELLGDPVTMLLQDRAGAIHVAQDMGHFGVKIKRSTDGGTAWEERAVPQYPPMPEGYEEIDPIRKTPVRWDLRCIWALENGHRDRLEELWCGTIPGGLFRSGDGGATWHIVEALWNHPDRKHWVGGGADFPGIHS
ncbi:MAG: exo-alpha-sialidase, partial [Gammaproteobacteria bacterium]